MRTLAAVLAIWAVSGAAAADEIRLVALGDSLTAGYGLAPAEALPVQLQRALAAAGVEVTVVNAGVSGDTTAGGLARLDWLLADRPTHAIVALGANDALRGLDPAEVRANLAAIIERLQAADVSLLLAGMLAPPNWGTEYTAEFNAIFVELAAQYDVPLYPFLLDGVATEPVLNQPDGIHPTAQGVAEIVRRLLPAVLALVAAAPPA